MNKILVTGATGMLGRYVRHEIDALNCSVIAPTRDEMNLLAPEKLYTDIKNAAPDIILHLAAETDVDLSEREPQRAGIANHLAVRSVARAAKDTKAWLLYISTSNVFGMEGRPLSNELDIPCPLNYYGRSKFMGEMEIGRICPENSLIIRAGWMIGGGRGNDHKFVGKIIEQITNRVESLRAVSDRYGTITLAPALAKFIADTIKDRRCGLYHYASSGSISRYDIACELAKVVGFTGQVSPISSAIFPLSAPRPVFEGITSLYLKQEDPNTPKNWKEDLACYLREFGY